MLKPANRQFFPAYKMARKFRSMDPSLLWSAVYDLYRDRYTIRARSFSKRWVCIGLSGQFARDETALMFVLREIHYQLWGY